MAPLCFPLSVESRWISQIPPVAGDIQRTAQSLRCSFHESHDQGLIMRIFGSSAGCLSVLFGLAFGLPALAEPSVDLDGPTAGWRYSGLLEQPDASRVAYPTPPIDRGGQRAAA